MKKSKKGVNKWEMYVADEVYPPTVESCFRDILHRIKGNKKEVVAIEKISEKMKEINDDFLRDIKTLKWTKDAEMGMKGSDDGSVQETEETMS